MIETTTKNEDLTLLQNSYHIFDNNRVYIDIKRLFFAYYKAIPNLKTIDEINCQKLRIALETNKKKDILNKHYKQRYNRKSKEMLYADLIYFMKDGCVINLEGDEVCIAFTEDKEPIAQQWINYAITFTKKAKLTNTLCLVIQTIDGLGYTAIKIKKPKLDLTLNYNEDMIEMHNTLLTKLRKKDASGLFLFHGVPGTGKSTYLKFLIHHLNKDVIFMSPKLAGNLDVPELMSFLNKNKNSVIIIEDAEELITSREGGRNSSISTLLNLTDGLLGECLNIQIIATFNTKIANIDKALLRKGRLQTLYEFKELTSAKWYALLQHLGIEYDRLAKEMTLAEIYNLKEADYTNKTERARIGFIQNA
jgi:hypothetical protein